MSSACRDEAFMNTVHSTLFVTQGEKVKDKKHRYGN